MLHINDLTYRIDGRILFESATAGIPPRAGTRDRVDRTCGEPMNESVALVDGEALLIPHLFS